MIRTLAASMNPMDRGIAEGDLRDTVPATFPMVLGIDIAGVVEDIGPGATEFAPGDEVFGQVMIAPLGVAGTYAEEIAVPEHAPSPEFRTPSIRWWPLHSRRRVEQGSTWWTISSRFEARLC